VSGGVDSWVANLVAEGITPRWQLQNPYTKIKEELQLLWSDWVPESDADGVCDYYGLQALIARSFIESGEVFARFRSRRLRDGLSVPLQVQIIESDHLDEHYRADLQGGNKVRMGIEFDKLGRRVAYWFFKEHPGEFMLTEGNHGVRVRVPASEILHIYRRLRPGQIRGKSWLAPIVLTIRELHQYDIAELVRKKFAAMLGGYITQPGILDNVSGMHAMGTPEKEEEKLENVVNMEPGEWVILNPGWKVEPSTTAEVAGGYDSFTERQDRICARGLGLPYEKYTGNLKKVTYSSIRAGALEFQRLCKMLIAQTLIFQFNRPTVNYWLDQAYLSDALFMPDYLAKKRMYRRVKWNPDGWEWVDPLKEVKAAKEAIKGGLKSRTQYVNNDGRNVEDVDTETSQDKQRAEKLGIRYDTVLEPKNKNASNKDIL
jgi:lambda family phage portal protein